MRLAVESSLSGVDWRSYSVLQPVGGALEKISSWMKPRRPVETCLNGDMLLDRGARRRGNAVTLSFITPIHPLGCLCMYVRLTV